MDEMNEAKMMNEALKATHAALDAPSNICEWCGFASDLKAFDGQRLCRTCAEGEKMCTECGSPGYREPQSGRRGDRRVRRLRGGGEREASQMGGWQMRICLREGRLGSDPVSRTTQSGSEVTSFSLATESGYGDKKKTIWEKVSCWGKLGKFAAEHLVKGMMVSVLGEDEIREWTGNDGEHHVQNDISAIKLDVLVWPKRDEEKDDISALARDFPAESKDNDLPF